MYQKQAENVLHSVEGGHDQPLSGTRSCSVCSTDRSCTSCSFCSTGSSLPICVHWNNRLLLVQIPEPDLCKPQQKHGCRAGFRLLIFNLPGYQRITAKQMLLGLMQPQKHVFVSEPPLLQADSTRGLSESSTWVYTSAHSLTKHTTSLLHSEQQKAAKTWKIHRDSLTRPDTFWEVRNL